MPLNQAFYTSFDEVVTKEHEKGRIIKEFLGALYSVSKVCWLWLQNVGDSRTPFEPSQSFSHQLTRPGGNNHTNIRDAYLPNVVEHVK
jgi:hypothetical protein